MSDIITFGKHAGMPYETILNTDISYCNFINRCPENIKTKHFKDWLKINIQRGNDIEHEKKIEILNKRRI